MSVNFVDVNDIVTPKGNVIKIQETNGGRILWKKKNFRTPTSGEYALFYEKANGIVYNTSFPLESDVIDIGILNDNYKVLKDINGNQFIIGRADVGDLISVRRFNGIDFEKVVENSFYIETIKDLYAQAGKGYISYLSVTGGSLGVSGLTTTPSVRLSNTNDRSFSVISLHKELGESTLSALETSLDSSSSSSLGKDSYPYYDLKTMLRFDSNNELPYSFRSKKRIIFHHIIRINASI